MTQATTKIPMTFRIYHGEQLVRTEQIAEDIVKIGKLPSSHLRIDDENVSRMHAVIEATGADEIYIIDLGSALGTVVNGKKVNKAKLESGDEIVLGDTRIVVEFGAPSVAVAPPARAAVPSAPPPVPPRSAPAPEPSMESRLSVSDFEEDEDAIPAAPAPSVPVPPPGFALPNPFAPPADAHAADEDPDKVQYRIVASGPPVHPDDVESHESAVEVTLMWGENSVLHVEHISPPRGYYVGEASGEKGKGAGVDYLMGSEVLGTDRMPVVVETGGGVAVVIPQGATGTVTVGEHTSTIADLQAAGRLQPCNELPGAMQYPLQDGATAKVQFKGFTFLVKPGRAGKKVAGAVDVDRRPLAYFGGSLLLFTSFLILFYFSPPSSASLSLDLLNQDSRLVKYLMEPDATVEEETPDWVQSNNDDKEGGTGKRHKDEEGAMGKEDSKKTRNKYGIEGPQDNPDPHMAREHAKEMAANAGILGTLRAMTGSWNSPTSPYGRDTALGNDPMSALGALMGDQIGENFGFGGLGLRGTGRGGGGTGEGTIGLGNLGTIGHGGGGGSGSGYGRGAGGLKGHSARVPQIRSGTADVRGSLSKEVIRRVIQRHINEVRFCYEQELNQRPDLAGRVTVKFIIAPDGAVQSALVSETTLGNQRVEGCVTQAVRRWTFPSPDGGGIVVVNYPFMLTAAGG